MALTKIDDRGLKTPIDLLDDEKIRLGTGNDLEIYHDSLSSYLLNKTGNLHLLANSLLLKNRNNDESYIRCFQDAQVELYYDGVKKFSTQPSGATVHGSLTITDDLYLQDNLVMGDTDEIQLGDSADLKIYHDGSNSRIHNATGSLIIRTSTLLVENAAGNENIIYGVEDGAVQLYYDGSKKLETTASGVQITGGLNVTTTMHIPDGSIGLQIGNSNDLLIFHDGSNSYIKTTNTNTNLILEGAHGVDIKHGGENMAKFRPDSSVELYHNNTKKFETTDDGAAVFGYLQIHSLPAVSYSDTREISLTNADLTRSNFYNHTNFESDSTILDNNGHFVAPVHGIYRLYVRISTDNDGGNRANIRLRKNGTTVNEAYAVNTSGMYQSVSSEIICELNQGQYLDVQVAQMHTMVGSQHKVVNFHMLG